MGLVSHETKSLPPAPRGAGRHRTGSRPSYRHPAEDAEDRHSQITQHVPHPPALFQRLSPQATLCHHSPAAPPPAQTLFVFTGKNIPQCLVQHQGPVHRGVLLAQLSARVHWLPRSAQRPPARSAPATGSAPIVALAPVGAPVLMPRFNRAKPRFLARYGFQSPRLWPSSLKEDS